MSVNIMHKTDSTSTTSGAGPLRVLHCIDALGPGGAETQFVQTLLHTDRDRFEHLVCVLQTTEWYKDTVFGPDIPIINLNIGGPRHWLKAVRGLRRIIKQYNIGLIHASTAYANIYAPLAARLEHVPIVFTLTTTYDTKDHVKTRGSFLRRWRVKNFYFWRAIALKMATAKIVAISNSVKESAVKHLGIPAGRIEVVYRGLDAEQYRPGHISEGAIREVKTALELDGAYPILINVARLYHVKGQKDLLRAMPFVLKSYPKAKLLVAGAGPLRDELGQLRETLGLCHNVDFLGMRQDVPLLLAASDIFIAASYLEGLSNAIVEAMAAGRPIVAFDIPVWREVLRGQAGILVEGRAPEGLAAAIVALASDSGKRRTLGSWGMQIVRENFDIRKNTRQLENIYESVLRERDGQRRRDISGK
jgi:glycosyltransferase involved in cell wall biosynthesis